MLDISTKVHPKIRDALDVVKAMSSSSFPIQLPVVIVTTNDPIASPPAGLAPSFVVGPKGLVTAGQGSSPPEGSEPAEGGAPLQYRIHATLPLQAGGEKANVTLLDALAADAGVVSIEPAAGLAPDLHVSIPEIQAMRIPPDLSQDVTHDGAGVIVGIVDFGFDFAHPNFIDSFASPGTNNNSRLLALWDQNDYPASNPPDNAFKPGTGPSRLWYGETAPGQKYATSYVFCRNDATAAALGQPVGTLDRLDAQIKKSDPYTGYYDPHANYYTDENLPQLAAHGTHVADIAAGNGRSPDSRPGVAPAADIVFVQIRKPVLTGWGASYLDVLNAVHFIFAIADKLKKPAVVNLSLNFNYGPHDGTGDVVATLNGMVKDVAKSATEKLPRMIVVSAGNLYGRGQHARVVLEQDDPAPLRWRMRKDDATGNALSIWYNNDSQDRLRVAIRNPEYLSANVVQTAADGNLTKTITRADGVVIGQIEVRAQRGTKTAVRVSIVPNPRNDVRDSTPVQINVALRWMTGTSVKRLHAWIERDDLQGRGAWQTAFAPNDQEDRQTLGELATGSNVIAVGAFYAPTGLEEVPSSTQSPTRWPLDASSSGPPVDYATLDRLANPDTAGFGSGQPFVSAPGVLIRAARSKGGRLMDGDGSPQYPFLTVMSGTSMAAPHVAGIVALLMHKNVQNLAEARGFQHIRLALRDGVRHPYSADPRLGHGRVSAKGALDTLM